MDYASLLDSAPDAIIVVGQDATILLVNRQTETLFGYARDELLGRALEMLIPARFRGGHGGHVHRYFTSPTMRPMGSGLRLFGLRKDGSELPIEVSLSPHQDGEHGRTVSAAIRDITDRVRLEERLASAVHSIGDAFALFDAEDRLVLCNPAYATLLGRADPASMVGMPYAALLDLWLAQVAFADDAARAVFRELRIANRIADHAVFDFRTRAGRRMRVVDQRTPEGGIVKLISDLTEEDHRETELRDARAIAEAASAAKSDFLASMSHELRTPLNAILGFAQLLERDRKEPLSARHKERVSHILRGGEHLLRLIDDILDLAKIEAGSVSLHVEGVAIRDVLAEVCSTLQPLAAARQIALVQPAAPAAIVAADRTRLAQIVINFGSNAIKYGRAGGKVEFLVEETGEHLRITVVDDGPGIPLDHQPKLFQPFQRAGQETGPIEGTGIGLVISKRLAEAMGGGVGFASEPERGSRFWVDIPIASAIDTHVRATPASAALDHAPALVLYVEDNPANVEFMRDLASTLDGLELATAPTAELGLAFARARHPAAILMDLNLPGMSGLDALRALAADPVTAAIPVIALTAAASPRERARGLEAGFFRYVAKPIVIDELLEAIAAALATRAS